MFPHLGPSVEAGLEFEEIFVAWVSCLWEILLGLEDGSLDGIVVRDIDSATILEVAVVVVAFSERDFL